ncbi:MAG: hypothetical protein ACRC92_25460 [Peptostreptococcaceae bacterium]
MARSVTALATLTQDMVDYINNYLYLGAIPDTDTTTVCFDCDLWNNGYSNESGIELIPPIKTSIDTLLASIITELNTLLASSTDYAFNTQIERLISVITDIKNKIGAIQCQDACGETTLLAQLLVSLVVLLTKLIDSVEYLNGLFAYYNACSCMGGSFFEIMMGRFINSITCIQPLVLDFNNIVMSFFQLSTIAAKSYVAAYVPNAPVIVPQPNQGPMQMACVPCPPRPPMPCPPPNNCTPFGGC